MNAQLSKVKFVVCIDNSNFPVSLERFKIYRQLQDLDSEQDGDIRIIDESGEDYVYPANLFASIRVPQIVKMRMPVLHNFN